MDLSFIQEQLDTFATFAGAIGDFLQKPLEFFQGLFGWFDTPEGADESQFEQDWADTSSALGSSNEAESGEEAGSSLSSSDEEEK
ncbi:PorH family porin [Corynebacterium ammoniagenes]|uniref:Uncharacterized protein n=2 Tax=Corynebacterium ammoniagenes TaxID=1697 RepID=A0AAV5G756_CORAM|nr:PorH family porin [Corynebacterium ammoniagenes]APT83457.1 aminotransferase [Corynebacterium ammoniagenes DSM 20306]AQS74459.1 aminotransferase [Corynebacterium ammoniagenes]EFG81338.1 hypothetical protein HMPREF0281_01511 [Corynebacterium ammoniagenes DSM 20306]GJN43136.1 hypothetical protein CAT723_16150 [Corynebacterium ammoniagenes]